MKTRPNNLFTEIKSNNIKEKPKTKKPKLKGEVKENNV